jgi:hypothetical protein
MSAPILWSALLLGAFGSVHCLAMCGGIAGALGQALDAGPAGREVFRQSLYSLGRISSYAVAGASFGWLGESFAAWTGLSLGLRILAGVLIIGFGLQVAGWWNGFATLERFGLVAWRRIAPWTKRVGRPDRSWKIFVLGALWGWLPCGLVYSALLAAASTGDAIGGAAFMVCFGLGTFPAMLTATGVGVRLGHVLASRSSRRAAGALLLLFGSAAILGAVVPALQASRSGGGLHDGHAPHAAHAHAVGPD